MSFLFEEFLEFLNELLQMAIRVVIQTRVQYLLFLYSLKIHKKFDNLIS